MDYRDLSFERLISNKDKSSYPEYLNDEILLISINKDRSQLIGSASYKIAKYPSDYDVFERVLACCSKEDIIKFFVKNIKQVVSNIVQKKNHWFMELKCGLDKRYNLNFGVYTNGYLKISQSFIDRVQKLYDRELLSDKEMNEMQHIIHMSKPGQLEFEQLTKILRDHNVIRWNAKEVLAGYKILPGNKKLTLAEAASDVSQINIELIAVVDNKITDLSNFFVLGYRNTEDKLYFINLPKDAYEDFYNFFLENLRKSIEKMYFSKLDYNPLKLVKRYWSYAKFVNDKDLIERLLPIINSDAAMAGQIKSELATIIKLLERTNKFPVSVMKNQLGTLKWRLSTVMIIPEDLEKKADKIINYIIKNTLPNKVIVELLNNIIDPLKKIIDLKTFNYLKTVNLVPPPNYLLPTKRTY